MSARAAAFPPLPLVNTELLASKRKKKKNKKREKKTHTKNTNVLFDFVHSYIAVEAGEPWSCGCIYVGGGAGGGERSGGWRWGGRGER